MRKNEQSPVGRVNRMIDNQYRIVERVQACGLSGFLASKIAAPTNNRIIKMVVTHGFSPMAQGSAFPLLILRNHAPSQFCCSEHSWLGYLIKDA